MIVLRCLGHAAHPNVSGAGMYLQDFDFEAAHDADAPAGSGRATFTENIAEAKRFTDAADFHAYYCRQPECCPLRWWSDGGPNRPMTGYSWQLVTVPE